MEQPYDVFVGGMETTGSYDGLFISAMQDYGQVSSHAVRRGKQGAFYGFVKFASKLDSKALLADKSKKFTKILGSGAYVKAYRQCKSTVKDWSGDKTSKTSQHRQLVNDKAKWPCGQRSHGTSMARASPSMKSAEVNDVQSGPKLKVVQGSNKTMAAPDSHATQSDAHRQGMRNSRRRDRSGDRASKTPLGQPQVGDALWPFSLDSNGAIIGGNPGLGSAADDDVQSVPHVNLERNNDAAAPDSHAAPSHTLNSHVRQFGHSISASRSPPRPDSVQRDVETRMDKIESTYSRILALLEFLVQQARQGQSPNHIPSYSPTASSFNYVNYDSCFSGSSWNSS